MPDVGAVNLGSAYGEFLIDTSSVESQLNRTFQNVESASESALSRVSDRLQSTGDRVASVGASFTKWTAPITAIGAIGLKTFGSFDDALTEIQARTGATVDEMEAVRKKALEMGKDTAFSATQSSEAMLQLLSSGYDLEETFSSLPAVLDAAAAGGMDLGFTADLVTDALAMWNMRADEAGRVSNALARASAASSAEMPDLAQGLGNVGPIAAQFGLSLEDTVAILAAFSERGIKGAEAGTQLRSMLNNLSKPSEKVTGLLDELNVQLYDIDGNVRPMRTIMNELGTAMSSMTEQERIEALKTLGGVYGQLGLTVLTSGDAMGDMLALMDDQADAGTVAEARLSSLNGKFSQLRSTIETLLIQALSPMIERYMKPMLDGMIALLNKVIEWIAANEALTSQIVAFLAALVAVGPTLMVVGKAISLVGILIGTLTNPIGLVVAAVGALYLAWKKNFLGLQTFMEPVVETVEYIFGWLEKAFDAGAEDGGFLGGLTRAFEALFYVFQDGETTFFSKFFESLGFATGSAQTMGLAIVRVKDGIALALRQMGEVVTGHIMPIVRSFFDFLAQAWEIVKPGLAALAEWFITAALPAIIGSITGQAIPAFANLVDIIGGVWEIVKPALLSLLDWFVNTGMPAAIKFVRDDAIPAIGDFLAELQNVWGKASPYLESLYDWFVDDALPEIREFILGDVVPALQNLWEELQNLWDKAEPKLSSLYNWFVDTALPAIQTGIIWFTNNAVAPTIEKLRDLWDDVSPKLSQLYSWFVSNGLPFIRNSLTWFRDSALNPVISRLGALWDDVSPKLSNLYGWFISSGWPAIQNTLSWVRWSVIDPLVTSLKNIWDQAGPKLQAFYWFVVNQIGWLKTNIFDPLKGAVQDVIDVINDVGNALSGLDGLIPDWLKPGSPTPLEMGLRGIKNAMHDVSRVGLDEFALGINAAAPPAVATASGAGSAGGNSVVINLTIDDAVLARNPDAQRYGEDLGAGIMSKLRSLGGGIANGRVSA